MLSARGKWGSGLENNTGEATLYNSKQLLAGEKTVDNGLKGGLSSSATMFRFQGNLFIILQSYEIS